MSEAAGAPAPGERRRIGVISDTHGLLRPEVAPALAGVDAIVHAGDVDRPGVLEELRAIAPLLAVVRGNVDGGPWARELPDDAVVECAGGRTLYLLHDLAQLDLDPVAAGFDVVIHGHSHRPRTEVRGGVLWLNPGSAGPRRFRLPVTLAILELAAEREPEVRIVPLLDTPG